jgi:hypothetical protein
MARGDEIEPGEPRRHKPAPSRYDDTDDERYDDLDDRPRARRRHRERSGVVNTVGIFGIILGSLALMCGMLASVGGALCAGFTPWVQKQMAQIAPGDPDMAQAANELGEARTSGWLALVEGLLSIVVGLGLLAGGIGVLRRSNIARWGLLAMALVNVLGDCADIVARLALDALDLLGTSEISTTVVSVVLSVGFAIFAFSVLLQPGHAREFAGLNQME